MLVGMAVGVAAVTAVTGFSLYRRRHKAAAVPPPPRVISHFSSIQEWMKSEELYGVLCNEFNLRRIVHKTQKKSFLTVIDNFIPKKVCEHILKECETKPFATTTRFTRGGKTAMVDQEEIVLSSLSDLPENYDEIVKRCTIFDAQYSLSIKRYLTKMKENGTCSTNAGVHQHFDTADYSLLCYLNTIAKDAGGATTFQDFGDFQPTQGMALYWKTAGDPLMLHGARRLNFGSKYILQTQH